MRLILALLLLIGCHDVADAAKRDPTQRTDSTESVAPASTGTQTVDTTKDGDFVSTIINKLNTLDDKLVADIDGANTLASEIDPNTNKAKDEIAAACYPQAKKFIVSLKGQAPAADAPKQGIVTLFERKRLLVMAIKQGLPNYLVIGCAPLLGDEAKVLVGVLGMAGINLVLPGGGLAALAAKLPVLGL